MTIAEAFERAAQVADAEAARQRLAANECPPWGVAQGERLRAKDAAMDIADAIRALAEVQP